MILNICAGIDISFLFHFQPTDRLKTEEEIAKAEKERLEKLEVRSFEYLKEILERGKHAYLVKFLV